MAKRDNTTFIKKANIVSTSTANKVSDVAGNIASRINKAFGMANKKISDAIEGNAETVLQNRQNEVDTAMKILTGTEAEKVLAALDGSPLELSNKRINQIRRTFPIPREQCILWADAEFDLRPSGIVVTERGVFIRSNVGVFDEKFKKAIEHENGGKSMLFYYIWDDFDPAWFTEDSKSNRALSVESQCSGKFISACHLLSPADKEAFPQLLKGQGDTDEGISKAPAIAGAAVLSSETAVFTEQKAYINNPAGHGEMVEEVNTMLDNYHGIKAKVVGRDNAKNGADRLVDGIFVQTKYYGTARGSLEACFDPTTGSYRYMNDGVPMQLEVPKDQYQRVLEGFKKKIADGKVPGVTDPNEASNIVREGRLTYQQAVNLTKPGTIESLKYDAATGVVICSCAFGITFIATMFLTWRKTGDLYQSIQVGASAGIQVFGISFLQHMVVSQVTRTGLANSLMAPSQYIVGKLGLQTSATIVNGLRALSGKSPISGVAATKQLAKILRSNVITSAITFAVFSVPETYNLASRKISGAQYAKNMTVLAGSIAAGAGGAVVAGVVAAKVTGAAGTAVVPGVGTAIGIAGGFVGGTVGAKTADIVGDIVCEDDVEIFGRLFNAIVSCMVSEYMLDESEIDKLIKQLDGVNQKRFKQLYEITQNADEQEETIRRFLTPYFDSVIGERKPFSLPSGEEIVVALGQIDTN